MAFNLARWLRGRSPSRARYRNLALDTGDGQGDGEGCADQGRADEEGQALAGAVGGPADQRADDARQGADGLVLAEHLALRAAPDGVGHERRARRQGAPRE